MRFTRSILALITIALLVPAPRALCQTNQPVPTLEEIKADFDAGKYQDVVKKATKALATKPGADSARSGSKGASGAGATPAAGAGAIAGKSLDRGPIEALKADAHLHLKQNQPAVEAFTAAARDTEDPTDVGLYRATALLIKRSRGQTYVPKAAGAAANSAAGTDVKDKPQPIDIIETDSRKKAFEALYNDESKAVAAKAASAKGKQNLKQIMDVLNDVLDLRAVELAGTGTDDGTKKMVGDLSDSAGKLMGDAVKTMSTTVEKISTTANQTTTRKQNNNYGPDQNIVTKRGLTSADKNTLGDIIVTCKDVEAATGQITQALGSDASASAIGEVKSSAGTLASRAEEVLKADYGEAKVPIDNTPVRTGTSGNTQQPQQQPQQPRKH